MFRVETDNKVPKKVKEFPYPLKTSFYIFIPQYIFKTIFRVETSDILPQNIKDLLYPISWFRGSVVPSLYKLVFSVYEHKCD